MRVLFYLCGGLAAASSIITLLTLLNLQRLGVQSQNFYHLVRLEKLPDWDNRITPFPGLDFGGLSSHNLKYEQASGYYVIQLGQQKTLKISKEEIAIKQATRGIYQMSSVWPQAHILARFGTSDVVVYENAIGLGSMCFQLNLSSSSSNIFYLLDSKGRVWVFSIPQGRSILLIQVYMCASHSRLKRIVYRLKNQSIFIFLSLKETEEHIQLLTRSTSSNKVTIRFSKRSLDPVDEIVTRTHQIKTTTKAFSSRTIHMGVFQGLQLPLLWTTVRQLIKFNLPDFLQKSELSSYEQLLQRLVKPTNSVVIDKNQNVLISLNPLAPTIVSLDKFLWPHKLPKFCHLPYNNSEQIISLLSKNQIELQKISKKIISFVDPKDGSIKIGQFRGMFETEPGIELKHIAFLQTGQQVNYPPKNKLDGSLIKTDNGFAVFKQGSYSFVSYQFDQKAIFDWIPQTVTRLAQYASRTHYEVQGTFMNLFASGISNGGAYLVNGQTGVRLLKHNPPKNFISTYSLVIDSEWWVFDYNQEQQCSFAHKYELFLPTSGNKNIVFTKRTYGDITSQLSSENKDDLGFLLATFTQQENRGFRLIRLNKGADNYYYFQFSDTMNQTFGVARIHLFKVSNRRRLISQAYSNELEKSLAVPNIQQLLANKSSTAQVQFQSIVFYDTNFELSKHETLKTSTHLIGRVFQRQDDPNRQMFSLDYPHIFSVLTPGIVRSIRKQYLYLSSCFTVGLILIVFWCSRKSTSVSQSPSPSRGKQGKND